MDSSSCSFEISVKHRMCVEGKTEKHFEFDFVFLARLAVRIQILLFVAGIECASD